MEPSMAHFRCRRASYALFRCIRSRRVNQYAKYCRTLALKKRKDGAPASEMRLTDPDPVEGVPLTFPRFWTLFSHFSVLKIFGML